MIRRASIGAGRPYCSPWSKMLTSVVPLGYIERVETLLLEELDKVRAILVRVTM
jgi:hypothetical protein